MGRPSIRSRSRTIDTGIVAAAAVASHAAAVGGGNIWLDHAHLEQGLALAAPGHWLELFTRGFAGTGFYRPLVALSFSVDASIAKTPLFFHSVTLAWHAAASLMTTRVARAFGCSRAAALGAGLLFAVHPVTSLVAAANAFRSEAMTTVFLLGLVTAHLAGRPLLAAGALFAAALTKETGWILGPLAVLVLELAARRTPSEPNAMPHPAAARAKSTSRSAAASATAEQAPRRPLLAAETLAFTAATLLHLAFAPTFRAHHAELSTSEVLGSRFAAFGKSALALLLPVDGSICDAFPLTRITEPLAIFGVLAFVGLVALTLRRDPAGPLGFALRPKPAAWLFALALVPSLQLVPVMRWWSPHYLYLPLAFGAILAAELATQHVRKPWLVGAVLLPLALLSSRESLRYASDASLWTAEVAREPACREGQFFLGEVAREAGELELAAAHYQRAASVAPGYLAYADEGAAQANLGAVRLAQRRFDDARQAFAAALARATDPLERRQLAHNLATAALASGDALQAAKLLEPEVRRSDALPESLFVCAKALHTLGREPEALALITRLGTATRGAGDVHAALPEPRSDVYDPLRRAYDTLEQVDNLEASVPSMCYTKTDGASNPCWVCHAQGAAPNARSDHQLQSEYAFSAFALTNHWNNLFVDRSADVERISDAEILAYVRSDNYSALKPALLASDADYPGYVPDLDFERGFDDEGFARDGSAWRALRYAPFPGTFWPTNGSTDDVFIRLPQDLRATQTEYKANLAILEAALGSDPRVADRDVRREIEPVDERTIGLDLDRNGKLDAQATRIIGLPARYVGDTSLRVLRNVYPYGTEFLHSVRYLDPDAPTLLARRMKELRYMRKVRDLDAAALREIYRQEDEEKAEGEIPNFAGSAADGLVTFLGWKLQGYIEDPAGRLRLQTDEEHRFCMGCHSGLGVTVDGTFAFPRKVPGAPGYRYQDLRGQHDRPQAGHVDPEVLTYLRRVRGGDELRGNAEMLARFVPDGRVNEREVRRAAVGGDRDLAWLLGPSRERALALDKAYLALVRRDAFREGRDPTVRPLESVHRQVENGPTAIGKNGQIYRDGRLQLAWVEPTRGRPRN